MLGPNAGSGVSCSLTNITLGLLSTIQERAGIPGLRFSLGWFTCSHCPPATSLVLCRCKTFSFCLLQQWFSVMGTVCVPTVPMLQVLHSPSGDSKVPLRLSIPALPGWLPALHCEQGAAPGSNSPVQTSTARCDCTWAQGNSLGCWSGFTT